MSGKGSIEARPTPPTPPPSRAPGTPAEASAQPMDTQPQQHHHHASFPMSPPMAQVVNQPHSSTSVYSNAGMQAEHALLRLQDTLLVGNEARGPQSGADRGRDREEGGAVSQQAGEVMLRRLIGTVAFLRRNHASASASSSFSTIVAPSISDQSKLLVLVRVAARCRHESWRATLAPALERVLYFIRQYAYVFFDAEDCRFVEMYLSEALAVPQLRQHAVETVIGILKYADRTYSPTSRCAAILRMGEFLSSHLLFNLPLHPSADILSIVLVKHVRLKDYPDYRGFSAYYRSRLIAAALSALRCVLYSHLIYSVPGANELPVLVGQYATVACTVLSQSRPCDEFLDVQVEAVRLLLACARYDHQFFAVAYQAGIFILRRELENRDAGVGVQPSGSSESPAAKGSSSYFDTPLRPAAAPTPDKSQQGMDMPLSPENGMPSSGVSAESGNEDSSPNQDAKKDLPKEAPAQSESESTDDGDDGGAPYLKEKPAYFKSLYFLARSLFIGIQIHVRVHEGGDSRKMVFGHASDDGSLSTYRVEISEESLSSPSFLQISVTLSALSETLLSFVLTQHRALSVFLAPAVVEAARGLSFGRDLCTGGGSDAIDMQVTDERFFNTMGDGAASMMLPQGSEMFSSTSTTDLDDIMQAILCLTVDVTKKELSIARSSVMEKVFRGVSTDYFTNMLKFQSISYQRSIGVLSSTSKIPSKHRLEMSRELSKQMRVLDFLGHLTLRFHDKNIALSMFPVLVEMLSYAKPFVAVKTISHYLVKCCIILGDEYFDIVLDLFCSTFSRSFDLVLRSVFNTMANSGEPVEAVDGGAPERIIESAEILRGVSSGLTQLIEHAANVSEFTADSPSSKLFPTVDVSDTEAAVVLTRCAKLSAIQRLLLNTYVELSGKFLQRGLDFASLDNFKGSTFIGNRGRDVEAFFWFIAGKSSDSNESLKSRKVSLLDKVSLSGCLLILLEPVSTCFQQLHFHFDVIELWRQDASLMEAWADNDMMQRYLKAYVEDIVDPILLRSFWQYIAMFHFSHRGNHGIQSNVHDLVLLMAKYSGPLLSLLHQSRSPVLGHNHRHWLSMEMEQCLVSRAVQSWASVSDEFGAMHLRPRKRSKALRIVNAVLSKVEFPSERSVSSVCFTSASRVSVDGTKDYTKFRGDVAVPVGVLSVLVKAATFDLLVSNVSDLRFEEKLLVTGIRCIESLRSQFRSDSSHHADMDHLLSYLDAIEDQPSTTKHLRNLVQLTVLDSFASWCYSLGDRLLHDTWAESRECVVARNVVVSTLNSLLRRFASPLSASRDFVVLFIYKMINTFAWALWHPSSVYCMLDQLTELEYAKFNLVSKDTMVLSQIGDEIAAVEALRSEHFSAITVEYISLCYHWCSIGYKLSPALMNSILVDYQLDRSSALEASIGNGSGAGWNGNLSPDIPLGISIAHEMSTSNAPIFHTVHPSSDAEFLRVTAASDSAVAQKSAELLLGLRKLFKRDKKSKKLSVDFWSRESAGALSIERRISAVNIAVFVEKSSHFKALKSFFDINKDVKIRPRNNFLLRLYDQPGPVYPHNMNPLEVLAATAPNIDQASRAYVRGILMNKFPSLFANITKRHHFSGRRVLRPYRHDLHLLDKIQTKIPFSSFASRPATTSAQLESDFNSEIRNMFEHALSNSMQDLSSGADMDGARNSSLSLETFAILCGCYLATCTESGKGFYNGGTVQYAGETKTVMELLGQCLILNFNPRMARVVVSALRWILSANPGLSSHIWSVISRVIVWSSDLHRGIFRSRFEKVSVHQTKHVEDCDLVGVPEPFDSASTMRDADEGRDAELRSLVEAEIGAHSVLISFMEELWVAVGDSNGILFGLLENVLLIQTKLLSLYAPSRYSVSNAKSHFANHYKSPQLLVPLMGILTLGLKCLKSFKRNGHPGYSLTVDRLETLAASTKHPSSARVHIRHPYSVCLARRRILRERVYECALSFFNGPKASLSAYSENMVKPDVAHERDTNLEIKTLTRFLDHIESDADLWRAEYALHSNDSATVACRKHGECFSSTVAGPGLQDVLARVEFALVRCKRPSSNAFDEGPASILCGKPIAGSEALKFRSSLNANPLWIFDRAYPDQPLRLQRLCGIDTAKLVLRANDISGDDDPDMFVVGQKKGGKYIRQTTGVLHLMKFLIHMELKRLYAWQTVSYTPEAASRLPLSDYAKSIVESNVARRPAIFKFAERCASPSSIQTAVLSAWTFHPSLALNIDSEFRYRRLSTTDPVLGVREQFYGSACLLNNEGENAEDVSDGLSASSDDKENPINRVNLPQIMWKRIFDASVPRLSDLIATNPLCLHGDFRSAEYILGIGGDVLYHMDMSDKSKSFSSSRTISKLKLWSMHGDKTIRTMLNRITHAVPEYTQVNFGNRVSHRSAYCPVYMLSHWQSCPPDFAIMLLQRPILGANGKNLLLSTNEIESDPERIPELDVLWAHDMHNHSFLVQYAIRSLSQQPPSVLMFYLPQLVQLIRQDSLGAIRIFLQELAKQSDLLCHQLVWLLETESVSEPIKHGAKKRKDASAMFVARTYGYCGGLPGLDPLPKMAQGLLQCILSSLPRKSLEYMNLECEYFNRVTEISAKLSLVKDKTLHNGLIKEALVEMGLYNGLYLPTHPEKLVVGVDVTSGAPMQSAAKCPFLLVFHTVDWAGPDSLRITASEADSPKTHEDGRATRSRTVVNETAEAPVSSILTNSVSPQSLQRIGLPPSFEAVESHLSEPSEDGSMAPDDAGPPTEGPPRPPLRTNRSFKKASQTLFIHNTDSSGEISGDDEDSVDVDVTEGHTVKNRGTVKRRNRKETIRGAVANDILMMVEGEKRTSPRFNTAPASVAKEFRRSLNMLSRSRGLRKGVQKWTSFAVDAKAPSDTAHASSMTTLSKREKSSGAHSMLDGIRLSANGSLKVSDTACIFKVYDDCRQDAMTIQLVRILHDAYRNVHGMPLFLYPYAVVPNRTGPKKAMGGIIQVIPNVKSRDDIGKSGAKTLLQMFRAQYGGENSAAFRKAQRAFACSQAAYAVVSYLLLIKDRHNGNLVIDGAGHVIHIDFGFLLGISPGGNLGFETAAFKLSSEMFELLGNDFNAEPFLYFLDMTVKAFLIARELKSTLLSVIASFADSGFPCFMYKDDNVERFLARFVPDLSDDEAAEHMRKLVLDACKKWTTIVYDGIQKLQNNIYSDTWK